LSSSHNIRVIKSWRIRREERVPRMGRR
jgi:hypothetical protein